MGEKYIVGLDGGTQSSKVTIFDTKGNAICKAAEKLKPLSMPQRGVAEHPDDDLWDSLCIAIRKAMELFPYDKADIIGVGLCSIRCCRALLDENGELINPVISWMDDRIYSNYEDSDPRVKRLATTTGYLTVRLTGEYNDTTANYRGRWPMDYANWKWYDDKESFESFGLRRDLLFNLVMPGDVLGSVTEEASKQTGLPAGIPVVATANDKAVEALGAGLDTDEKVGLISLGTFITSMVPGKEFIPPHASFWTNHACMPRRFLHESQAIARGMSTVSWFRDLLGDDLKAKAEQEGLLPEQYLERGAKDVPPGSLGLLTVPRWLTFDKPPYGRGIIMGFEGRHNKYHMYRSILEGIAFTISINMNNMLRDLNRHIDRIIISGGGSNSDLLMQIFADVFGIPVVRNRVNESVSMGSAISVAVGLGIYPDYSTAIEQMVQRGDEFLPDPETHVFYRELIEDVFKQIPIVNEGLQRKTYSILYG